MTETGRGRHMTEKGAVRPLTCSSAGGDSACGAVQCGGGSSVWRRQFSVAAAVQCGGGSSVWWRLLRVAAAVRCGRDCYVWRRAVCQGLAAAGGSLRCRSSRARAGWVRRPAGRVGLRVLSVPPPRLLAAERSELTWWQPPWWPLWNSLRCHGRAWSRCTARPIVDAF
jgi:hypothetical protein